MFDPTTPGDYDYSSAWVDETGSATGDARENDPRSAGFTDEQDRVYRSHFQRVNRLADRAYEQARPAYTLGWHAAADQHFAGRDFEIVEKDLENGWLNVRTNGGEWASVRDLARAAFDDGRSRTAAPTASRHAAAQGSVSSVPSTGAAPHDRPPYRDPVADSIDPTSPESPEQTLEGQDGARRTTAAPSSSEIASREAPGSAQ
jgi:hypothetical protein